MTLRLLQQELKIKKIIHVSRCLDGISHVMRLNLKKMTTDELSKVILLLNRVYLSLSCPAYFSAEISS